MQKRRSHQHSSDISLPKPLEDAWRSTIIQTARIRGISRDASAREKLKQIMKDERSHTKTLWEAFNTDRGNLPRYLLDPKKQTSAYLLGFHLPNCARFWNLLERSQKRTPFIEKLKSSSTIRVIDLGCGTGAGSQTTLAYLRKEGITQNIEFNLFDFHGSFLDTARTGLKEMNFEGNIKSSKGRLEDTIKVLKNLDDNQDTTNIVILGYVWNEMSSNPKGQRAILELLEHFSSKKSLILTLEPANQYLARSAMELREELVSMAYNVAFPCTSQGACPMLLLHKDWCYSEARWSPPKTISDLDKYIGINREKISYTGYTFCSSSLLSKKVSTKDFAVVGRPTIKNHQDRAFQYLVCNGQELKKEPHTIEMKTILRGNIYKRGTPSWRTPSKKITRSSTKS